MVPEDTSADKGIKGGKARGGWFNRTQNLATLVIFDRDRDAARYAARVVMAADHGANAWCAAGKDLAPLVLDQEDWGNAVAFARAIYRGKQEMPPPPPGVEDYEYDPVEAYKEWNPSGPAMTTPKHR